MNYHIEIHYVSPMLLKNLEKAVGLNSRLSDKQKDRLGCQWKVIRKKRINEHIQVNEKNIIQEKVARKENERQRMLLN